MQKKKWLRIFIGLLLLIALIYVLVSVIVEPLIEKKIRRALNANSNYSVEVTTVNLSLLSGGLELNEVRISADEDSVADQHLHATIERVKFNGVRFLKALFKKDIDINAMRVSNAFVRGEMIFEKDTVVASLAPANFRIDHVVFENLDLEIGSDSSAVFYNVKEGNLSFYNIQVLKDDTLSRDLIGDFDFNAKQFDYVSSDSMYTMRVSGIDYVANTKTLTIDSFKTLPNYEDYEFTARHRYQTDRIEATLQDIRAQHFSVTDFLHSKHIIADYIKIGKMDFYAFRDRRKEMRDVVKPMIQDLIRDYPGDMHVDSFRILNGDITYKEHAVDANQAGTLAFDDIDVRAVSISNDTSYSQPLKIWFNSKLMGEAPLLLEGKMDVFDPQNRFSVTGSLGSMDARQLNPILERNKFIFVTSGKVDGMQFHFTADRQKSSGTMTMLYRDFEIAVKNKRTDETTGLISRAASLIANLRIMNANPQPGKEVRTGTIDGERDLQKFMFYYSLTSILSGIESTLIDRPDRKTKK